MVEERNRVEKNQARGWGEGGVATKGKIEGPGHPPAGARGGNVAAERAAECVCHPASAECMQHKHEWRRDRVCSGRVGAGKPNT